MKLKKLVKRQQLSANELKHIKSAFVKLTDLKYAFNERLNICGVRINVIDACKYKFSQGSRIFSIADGYKYREIAVNNRVLSVFLRTNCLNLKISSDLFTPRKSKNALMLNNEDLNKSIIKNKENGYPIPISTPNKTVSFNNTYYISPIPARPQNSVNSYENTFKEYLKKMNGSVARKSPAEVQLPTPEEEEEQKKEQEAAEPSSVITENASATVEKTNAENVEAKKETVDDEEDEEAMEVEMLDDEPPRRPRGRPKGSGKLKHMVISVPRDPSTPPRRRGWPLGVPRKKFGTHQVTSSPATYRPVTNQSSLTPGKRGPGRPRKIIAFGFQTIVTDIKSVNLPNDLWSAHVSVTSKRSQVCFTRIVPNGKTNNIDNNNLQVDCDRSVKFNGTVKYIVRINNRDVNLLGAPEDVNSLRDIEILLDIVNHIGQNDPVLEYLNR